MFFFYHPHSTSSDIVPDGPKVGQGRANVPRVDRQPGVAGLGELVQVAADPPNLREQSRQTLPLHGQRPNGARRRAAESLRKQRGADIRAGRETGSAGGFRNGGALIFQVSGQGCHGRDEWFGIGLRNAQPRVHAKPFAGWSGYCANERFCNKSATRDFRGFPRCKKVSHYPFDWRYICAMQIGYVHSLDRRTGHRRSGGGLKTAVGCERVYREKPAPWISGRMRRAISGAIAPPVRDC